MEKYPNLTRKFLLFLLFLIPVTAITGQNAIRERFDKLEQSTFLKHAVIGFELFDLQTKQIIAAENSDKALTPASVMKTLTTASALELLGGQYRFKTTLYASGEIEANGTLNGNLIVVGGGDPTTGSSFFSANEQFAEKWVEALTGKGIKKIAGRICVDAGCYDDEAISAKWLVEDVGNYYAPGSYGVSIFDNSYRLTLQNKAAIETPEIVYCYPDMKGYLTFTNRLIKGEKTEAYIEGLPFNYSRMLKGTIATTSAADSVHLKGDIPNVPLFMEYYLSRYFREKGIEIMGQELPADSLTLIEAFTSPSLIEIVRVTNYRSVNLFADHLLKQIGYEASKMPGSGTFYSGAERLKSFWKSKGIDLSGFTICDGSGLASSDKISANALNSVLAYMYNVSKNRQTFQRTLPQAGKEGTVTNLIPNNYTQAAFFLKSGSMGGVRAYSGYIVKGEKHYCITILCNNFSASGSAVTKEIASFLTDLGGML